MSYFPRDPISRSQLYLDLMSNRQEALSSNLANMDTPNYVRRDIEFSQYLNTMNSPLENQIEPEAGAFRCYGSKAGTAFCGG